MNPQLHSRFFALFFFCLCLSTLSLEAQQDEEVIIYVDESKASNVHLLRMDSYGKNWSTAFRNLHDALRFGDPKATQIWMAKGNYYVDQGATFDDQKNDSPTTDYLNPFLVSNRNLTIYGGFAGTETSLEDRDLTNADNATYLDGNVYYKSTDDLPSNTDFGKWTQRFAERILVVHNSTLTLDGLVFQYVRAADHSSNSGAGDGGFIAANQSALKINNCLFQYGILGYDGQILYVRNNTEPLEIRNSRLAKCGRAESFIYLSSVDKVTLNNSVIEELKTGTDQSKVIYLFNTTADLEFKNNVLANNEYLQIRVGAVNRGAIDIDIENLLAFNNTLEDDKNDDGFLVVLSDYDTTKSNVNVSIANASFINNTGSNSMIYFEDDNIAGGSENFTVSLQNNVFYGNKTKGGGGVLPEILTAKEEGNKSIVDVMISASHNATDKSNSKLITNSDQNTGAVDLSSTSSLTELFVGTNDNDGNFVAKGADDKWFTADDGFVPKASGVLHNVGDNTAVTGINKDLKGDARVQETTVDIGAYEHGTKEAEALSIAGLSAISELVLYPNPIRSSQEGNSLLGYVTDPSSKPTRLVLRDLGGKLVRDLPIEDSGKGIELGVLPTGTYLAILSTENKGYKSFKLVVE